MNTIRVIPKEILDDPESPPLPSAQEIAERAAMHCELSGNKEVDSEEAAPRTSTESGDNPEPGFPPDG